MPYIVGTAGHIDHGKTSLIKALTGQDTDRLKEEKERGISIDLGFAHLQLPGGMQAGVVDVPGHERFIKNMLAGAHGIDLVLFTVAADDGVMPQTEEHLDIVHLLGLQRAIFVVTKVDLVAPARVREVEEEIQILVSGTALEGSPILPFSAVTEQGLPELRSRIATVLQSWDKPRPRGYFRLPVDRVFVLQGHGVVVTGTAASGEVAVGERVRCQPGGQLFRVRSVQVHGEPKDTATWGQRIALNLVGEERASLERGDVICHELLTRTTDLFDATLEVRPMALKGIKSHQRVRVHIGTAERLGKVTILGSRQHVGPKQVAPCQISLSEPVLTLRGDRFIVRDETAQRTLGGGTVLHPWPTRHKRAETGLEQRMNALQTGEPGPLLLTFLEGYPDFATPMEMLYQFLNVDEAEAKRRAEQAPGVRTLALEGETLYTTDEKWQHLAGALVDALRAFHAGHPLLPGMEMEALRSGLADQLATRLFRACVEQLVRAGVVAREGNLLRLPEHQVHLQGEEQDVVRRVKELMSAQPLAPPDVKQLERDLGHAPARLAEILRVMERNGSIVRVAVDLYFLAEAIDTVRAAVGRHLMQHGSMTAATFRDLFGTSRKYAIPLLEYFDRDGLTIRVGDTRRLREPRRVDAG
jgi:selenocysteine-specific elongation factor